MSSRLTMIAHATTPAVRAAAFPLDEGIDESGRREAQIRAGTLPKASQIWTSPSARTIETSRALGLDARIDPTLTDLNVGQWAGRAMKDIEATNSDALALWIADPSSAPHGGESIIELHARIGKWLDDINGWRARVLAVTHPAVIRAAIVCAIDAKPSSFWSIDVAPLASVELRSNGARWTLRSLNVGSLDRSGQS